MSVSWQYVKANPDAAARTIRDLQRENEALREDWRRLEWYFSPHGSWVEIERLCGHRYRCRIITKDGEDRTLHDTFREAIDYARKQYAKGNC